MNKPEILIATIHLKRLKKIYERRLEESRKLTYNLSRTRRECYIEFVNVINRMIEELG